MKFFISNRVARENGEHQARMTFFIISDIHIILRLRRLRSRKIPDFIDVSVISFFAHTSQERFIDTNGVCIFN